ncbi:MAG TPA: DUF1178 family protein [Xanthobacteraceae bacterium]|nr:DUF1178 family protein [Xanthobacteraceae bacterium]
MIRYALACENGHAFESWFQSSAAYDKQAARGLVVCPTCGSTEVEKSIMAPNLARSSERTRAITMPDAGGLAAPNAAAPITMISPAEQEFRAQLKKLRDHLIKNAEYVGPRFPEEARKMHYGEIEHRSIYGEASPDDAKALHEEGIEFHPLPVLPEERN